MKGPDLCCACSTRGGSNLPLAATLLERVERCIVEILPISSMIRIDAVDKVADAQCAGNNRIQVRVLNQYCGPRLS
jgi:hypothetical protein